MVCTLMMQCPLPIICHTHPHRKVSCRTHRSHLYFIPNRHILLTLSGIATLAVNSFGVGLGPIFLDEVDCSETDSMLLHCHTFTPIGVHGCSHTQDVGIYCEGT